MKGARPLTESEINEILVAANPRDRVMVLTCLYFGTRISEALALTFASVEGKTLHLKSAKNSNNQGFPIPDGYKVAVKALKAWYREHGIEPKQHTKMFLSVHVKPHTVMSRQNAGQVLKTLIEKIGAEGRVSTHSLRKAFVTRIYEKTGFNIVQTQHYSRHKSLSNLQFYIQTCESLDLVNDGLWG